MHLLGVVSLQKGRLDEAAGHIRRAIEIEARQPVFHCNLGEVLRAQGRLDEAMASNRSALRLQNSFAAVHNNLALALQTQGDVVSAQQHFEDAIRIQADYVEAHYNLSRVLLLRGQFERGWQEYAWRLRMQGHPSQLFDKPAWDGRTLGRETLLVYAEQGLGDTLQFVRYLAPLAARAPNVVFAVPPGLKPLLEQSGYKNLLPPGDPLPPFDLHCSLLSLPGLLHTTIDTIPAKVPYLNAAAPLVERWHDALANLPGRKIGIAWQGNRAFYSDRFRSIALQQFAPLADVPGVQLVSLQKGEGSEQIALLADRFNVHQLPGDLDTRHGAFMDTAAVMRNLDLVITSDTSIAHLAGALAVPVWLALPIGPDWRWLLDRDDSPWYPTMRLFRQSRHDDWSDVFERMAGALQRGER